MELKTIELTLKSGAVIKANATRGDKPANWEPSGNHYRINATYNGRRFSFDFWDSIANTQAGEPCDVRGALHCWASDVSSGLYISDVDELAEEFGYTKPSEALRVFNALKASVKQYERLGMSEEDLQELGDY
jgi:hypothetical protein